MNSFGHYLYNIAKKLIVSMDMNMGDITPKRIKEFHKKLKEEEKSTATIDKYRRDVERFYEFLPKQKIIDKKILIEYKEYLIGIYKDTTVNSILASINSFLLYIGRENLKMKRLKIQRPVFCSVEKELSKTEYMRLLKAAKDEDNHRLYYAMQTLCATGIRISELASITVQAVKNGQAHVRSKGKKRIVLIPVKLRNKLIAYASSQKIKSGRIFITRSGNALDRSNIWSEMKKLCKKAGVSSKKVFPHNLRHLFARVFYSQKKDLVKLADVLGHSQIETTRIYMISTAREHEKQIDALGLVV